MKAKSKAIARKLGYKHWKGRKRIVKKKAITLLRYIENSIQEEGYEWYLNGEPFYIDV